MRSGTGLYSLWVVEAKCPHRKKGLEWIPADFFDMRFVSTSKRIAQSYKSKIVEHARSLIQADWKEFDFRVNGYWADSIGSEAPVPPKSQDAGIVGGSS